ncbi:MAG TPA: GtrA family protein [Gammaproteobacteria bacterium]|nr:GtrA family protein [Gammaproteobacteria bacterium]
MLSHSFSKSQIAALIATIIDFLCLIVLVELFQVWYPVAIAIAALLGAIGNFLLGRHWSFVATNGYWHHQASRYFFVSSASLILNTVGVYSLTEFAGLQYLISKSIVALIIGVVFNYPLHRYYVFRTHAPQV